MKNKLPYKTFNLFWSYNAEVSFVDQLYKWIISVGRYIVIGVELVVLSAFVARFVLDQQLNDLTEKITDDNKILVSMKDKEAFYRTIFSKTNNAKTVVQTSDGKLMTMIPTIYSLANTGVKIISIDYSNSFSPNIEESISIVATMASSLAPLFQESLTNSVVSPLKDDTHDSKLILISTTTSETSSLNYNFKITRTAI